MNTMRDPVNVIVEASVQGDPVPPEPGTLPIPPGMTRRFHVTGTDRAESVRMYGLRMVDARGIEGPRGVYSWDDWTSAKDYGSDAGRVIVEFWDDPEHYRFNRFASLNSVPPEQILALHAAWHDIYRYALDNDIPAAELREVGFDDYVRAADALDAGTPD